MNKSTKRVVGWGTGMGIGASLLVLIAVLVMIMTSEPSAQVDPAAGKAPVVQEDKAECDFPSEWIGQPVDENAVKKASKVYRILGPDSMATMDYSADRINVHTDKDGVVTKVTCG